MAINTILDSNKVCQYMPVVVSVTCIIVYMLEISYGYTLFFMLFVGFGGSLFLHFQNQSTKNKPITNAIESIKDEDVGDQSEESVFVDVDYAETLLLNLEAIILMVNSLSAKQIESSRVQTEDAVTAVINRVLRLSEDLTLFSKKHELEDDESMQSLQHCISDILLSFQFQDRTSQILNHVSGSLEIFNSEIKSIQELRDKGGEPEYDSDAFVKKITAGFTTAEQHEMLIKASSSTNKNAKYGASTVSKEANLNSEDNVELF